MIVIDASAAIEWLLQTAIGIKVAQRLTGETLNAPHLLDLEVAHTMRRALREGWVVQSRAEQVLQDLNDTPIKRYEHKSFLTRIWALRANLTAYDAAYVALAEALNAPLLTLDTRIGGAAGHRARVEIL